MIVHYHHMTGDELKRIYKISGLKSEEFASKLGLEKHQLYTQFGRQAKKIDREIEEKLKEVSELAQHQLILVKQQNSSSEAKSEDSGPQVVKFLTDTIQVLKDVLVKGEKQSEAIIESNKHIREEAAMYRRMLLDGYEAGLLQWNGHKPKKTA